MWWLVLCSLLFGCAFGQAAGPNNCYAKGFAIGRSKIHVTCIPARKFETPVIEEPKITPIHDGGMNNCPGKYDYFHECIDGEPQQQGKIARASSDEAYIEIAGAPPSTSFWSTVFDFLVLAGTAAMTYFKVGG